MKTAACLLSSHFASALRLPVLGCAAGLFLALLALPARAQTARPELVERATGEITGRVQNETTGKYLNNARVTVKGTDLTVFTDETGTFRLIGVPAGAAT